MKENPLSLACVFLTDRGAGLGVHGTNPDTPGQCWCPAIYGRMSAEAYICHVDLGKVTEEELKFRKADAAAMGQCLVEKASTDTEKQWLRKLSNLVASW